MKNLVCDGCREKYPSLMSCIHTFGPRSHKSTILTEPTAIPGVVPDSWGDRDSVLVESSRVTMPESRRLEPNRAYNLDLSGLREDGTPGEAYMKPDTHANNMADLDLMKRFGSRGAEDQNDSTPE